MHHSYAFTEPAQTTSFIQVSGDEMWITSIPEGAHVYVQPYDPEHIPSHATASEAYRGKTPLRFPLSPGSYWIEVALDADVFDAYFSPPFDDAQFEQIDATYGAVLFRPLTPGEKRRVLRYYRVEKEAQQGEKLVALFYPRGASLERVAALYPRSEQYDFAPEDVRSVLHNAQVPPEAHDTFLSLLRRGGKAFWGNSDASGVSLEVGQGDLQGRTASRYTGPSLPVPLLPDGGGF